MRILKIKWATGEEDLEMEEWIKSVIPDMTKAEVLDTEVYE